MGYRIEYAPAFSPAKAERKHPLRLQLLCAVFLLLFILTVKSYWPAGTHRLQQLLLPQPATVAARQAFSELVTDLENGESFSDSITAFCREVIAHANTQ